MTKASEKAKKKDELPALTPGDLELLNYHGTEGLIRIGLQAAHERVTKNRIIFVLCAFLRVVSDSNHNLKREGT